MVLVDSDIWSAAFRRKEPEHSPFTAKLKELIEADEARIIGLIRQEVLSGIRAKKDFERVRNSLRAFPDQPVSADIHELAASFFNTCRKKGIQGSHTDFLICGCSVAWKMKIFSRDGDYENYQNAIPIDVLTID